MNSDFPSEHLTSLITGEKRPINQRFCPEFQSMDALNAEMNITTPYSTPEEAKNATESTPFAVIVKILMVLAIALNLLLNPLMLFTLRRVTSIQPTTQIFMASLTLSDLCNSVWWIPHSTELFAGTWLLGDFLCAATIVMDAAFTSLSVYSLLLLTVDRYIAISHPLRYPSMMTEFRSKILVCSTWTIISTVLIFGFGVYSPTFPLQYEPQKYVCLRKSFLNDWQIYLVVVFLILPLLTIFILYAHIILIARNQTRRIAAENQAGNGQGRQRINTRSTTTVIIIAGTLIITWIPTLVRVVIFLKLQSKTYNRYLAFVFTQALLVSNGWLNAVIYYLRNRDLRQTLCGLLSDWFHSLSQRFRP